MKKTIKNTLKILVLILLLALPKEAFADQIKSIDVDVQIDRSGIGHVTETWKTVDDNRDATEKYKVITDLGDIKIRDFSVVGNSREYSEKEPWDIDASFDEKAYRYGMVETGDGYELCWGISEFGENEFVLTYTIDPVVIRLNDYDMLHYRFIKENLDPAPDKITIRVSGYEPFTTDDVSFWTFGFEGTREIEDGVLVAESTGQVNYGHVMMRFPQGTFDTNYSIDENFDYFSGEAVRDSDWEIEDDSYYEEEVSSGSILGAIGGFLGVIIAVIAGIVALVLGSASATGKYGIVNKKSLEKEKKFKDQYYRDIPYEGPIEDTYLIASNAYPDIPIENYLNAFMLKWIYEDAISFGEDEVKKVIRTVTMPYIQINHKPKLETQVEADFFNILEAASKYSDDGKIRQKHIERYMEKNKSFMEDYLEEFPENSLDALVAGGYLVNNKTRNKSPFAKDLYKNKISITDSGINLYENFIKFKNYLKDYSLIEERNVNEVKLWDRFMIYAAIYGISQEVYENFTAVYPDYAQISYFDYYMISGLNNFSTGIGRSIQATVSPDLSAFESAGSGGFSSLGGGGGGFGGGSGGSGGGSR